jgi:hypothetical protein
VSQKISHIYDSLLCTVSLGGCNKFFIGGGFHVLITLEITYKIKKVDECTMQIRKQSKFYSSSYTVSNPLLLSVKVPGAVQRSVTDKNLLE